MTRNVKARWRSSFFSSSSSPEKEINRASLDSFFPSNLFSLAPSRSINSWFSRLWVQPTIPIPCLVHCHPRLDRRLSRPFPQLRAIPPWSIATKTSPFLNHHRHNNNSSHLRHRSNEKQSSMIRPTKWLKRIITSINVHRIRLYPSDMLTNYVRFLNNPWKSMGKAISPRWISFRKISSFNYVELFIPIMSIFQIFVWMEVSLSSFHTTNFIRFPFRRCFLRSHPW